MDNEELKETAKSLLLIEKLKEAYPWTSNNLDFEGAVKLLRRISADNTDIEEAAKLLFRIKRKCDERVIDRFIEAYATGEICKTSRAGPRRIAAISCGGLGLLYNMWPEALRRVIELGKVHPAAQMRFLKTWTMVPLTGLIAKRVGDDDLFYKGIRLLLPPYEGEGSAVDLFRGQGEGEIVGPSWSRSFDIAYKFALFGWNNVDPHALHKARTPPRTDGIILHAKLSHPCAEIICAPCLLGHVEGEYILDPRTLNPKITRIGAEELKIFCPRHVRS